MSRIEEFEEFRPLLFSIAYRILGSVAEAEDAVQESWLRYRATPTDPASPKAFLSAIASLFGYAAASRLAPYVDAGGGGGISYDIPFGSEAALLLRAACGAGHR